MPRPGWQAKEAPFDEIVVSCRTRAARNLRTYRFPHFCSNEDLRSISAQIVPALEMSGQELEVRTGMQEAERDFLLGCRLISSDFLHRGVGRSVALNPSRTISVMVNEEDHLRLQCLTPGWTIQEAQSGCTETLGNLSKHLNFAFCDQRGFLTASPTNVGRGTRMSALFHLMGLGQSGRLPTVLRALGTWGFVARGLFGETSRAIGAFFQVSTTSGKLPEFIGACEFLIAEEASARAKIQQDEVRQFFQQACRAGVAGRTLSLSDSIKILSWVRFGLCIESNQFEIDHRDIDHWMAQIEVHGTTDLATAARHRAEFCRERLEPLLGQM